MSVRDQLKAKRKEIRRLAHSHGATAVRVFGSAARQDRPEPGDLDLLVRMRPGSTLLDIVAIKQDIEELLGCRTDVVTEAALSPYIRQAVLAEAREL